MSSYFGLQGEQLQDRLISLFRHGDHRKLLVLDNFESPWENMMRRGDVENFLSTLSGIKELGIIVTMRGAERPSGTLWSRPFLPMIAPYDRSAARDTFLAITDGDPHDPHLDILLDYADDLPLAVTLIAATAQYEPTSELVDRWKSDGTALADHGQHRKNSLDISIRITLESPRIARFPEALQVLSLLSLLPEGVELDDVRAFAPDVLKPEGAISILLGNALVFRVATGRLKVLAPLRNFIQHHHFPSSSAFWNLCKRYAEVASSANRIGYPGCGATYRKLGGEIGNIESLLVNSAEHEMPVLPLVEAIPPLCIFASLSGLGSIERLRCAIDLADDLQSPHLRASCFLGIARIQRIRGTDPTPFVEEAEALYRQLESTRGLADVDIFRGLTKVVLSGDHSDLIRTLEAALPSYDLSPDYRARCDCLIALGQRQIRQKLYSKAETTFHLALSESTQFSFLDGMGLAYYRLGTIYYFQSRFGAADEVYLKSSECFAQLPYAYGVTTGPTPEIPCMMNDYEEALCRSRDRRIVSKSQGWLRQGALSGLDIALAYIDLYRLDEAEEEIAEVRNAITEFHSAWEESLCDMLEGDIALQRGDLGASEKLYARSIEIYPPLRWEYYYRRTGDLAMAKNDTDKAFTQFLIGFLLARKSRVLINELKTGQIPCLRRIADIILEKSGRADIAEGVYWDLLGFTEFLGLRRESAGCFRGLGIVAKERGLESMAVKYWGRALKLSRDTQDSRAAEELERMAARLDVPETGKP
ncbi:hypothetical protein SISSUDRAFT_1052598 [Sistotremastrum suecicum HHB10207 ss-3]|uniref:TPR-like protein n=1 Tax=Sistotremastrum suecicum HHB10207 ss-3 TaxID=1314776 RepID=A0A165ZRG7_9AGAM|nr:hypothetical protein SISSUDRAFT_1052598 [Sistotremastrum suecicum HHB10207 ss-3]